MAHLVRELLEIVRLDQALVLDHVVRGGVDGALAHGLGDQEEVESVGQGDHVVHHRAGGRVL